jgi:solute carrier family 38 (sodium-coupled neutral amino acid transporter), member 11
MDELDDPNLPTTPSGHMDQSMPLLVGLFESSESRRSLDATHTHELTEEGDYDLEEIAAKRMAGGGIIDSIANMANSILGAGKRYYSAIFAIYTFIGFRDNR